MVKRYTSPWFEKKRALQAPAAGSVGLLSLADNDGSLVTELDFNGALFVYRTINLIDVGALFSFALSTANLVPGAQVCLRIVADNQGDYILTLPAWNFIGNALAPASITAGKVAILSLTSFGTTDAEVIAAYAEEQ